MVTETLKNGIFIPIDTSKESDFNDDFDFYAKVWLSHNFIFQTIKNFSVKSEALRRRQPLSYKE